MPAKEERCPRDGGPPYLLSVHGQQHGENCPNEQHVHLACQSCDYRWTSKRPEAKP